MANAFDVERYVRIQTGAVNALPYLTTVLQDLNSRGIDRVFFMGSGGAQILSMPAAIVASRYSTLPVAMCFPAEVPLAPPAGLSDRSLVVVPSLSGTTEESVSAVEFAKSYGAHTLSLTGNAESKIAVKSEYTYTNKAADDTSSESFYIQTLLVVLTLLHVRGEFDQYNQVVSDMAKIPEILAKVKCRYDEESRGLASEMSQDEYHIFTAAGVCWPEAHYFAMCILEEMQWIRTRPVHAADFFHGTLELLDRGVSIFILKGYDDVRPLVDRIERFARRYTDRMHVIEGAAPELADLSSITRKFMSPVVLAAMLERLSYHLSILRQHPLSTRRYYKRVAY